MLDKTVRISDLQVILDKQFGKGLWLDLEPETILLSLQCPEYLVAEKIYVLQCLNKALNSVISLPEFLLWTTSVCNNEHAEFEILSLPTSLELAWALQEVRKVAGIIGETFSPTEELVDVVSYMLRLEGFSKSCYPLDFVPETKLETGQTAEDIKMKEKAVKSYIAHMEGIQNA